MTVRVFALKSYRVKWEHTQDSESLVYTGTQNFPITAQRDDHDVRVDEIKCFFISTWGFRGRETKRETKDCKINFNPPLYLKNVMEWCCDRIAMCFIFIPDFQNLKLWTMGRFKWLINDSINTLYFLLNFSCIQVKYKTRKARKGIKQENYDFWRGFISSKQECKKI